MLIALNTYVDFETYLQMTQIFCLQNNEICDHGEKNLKHAITMDHLIAVCCKILLCV